MIRYRNGTAADGAALDGMASATWMDTFGHGSPPEDSQLYIRTAYGPLGKLIEHLADPAYRFRVAWDGDAVAGYAKLAPSDLDDAVVGTGAIKLDQLYVARAWQGAGVGLALMAWSTEVARSEGATSLVLTVWEENDRARKFYERRGFAHVGDYEFQVGNQVDRDLIMRLSL